MRRPSLRGDVASCFAAYFAAEKADSWALGESYPPDNVDELCVWAFHEWVPTVHGLSRASTASSIGVSLVSAPAFGNPNLHAQDGAFTLVRPSETEHSSPVDRTPFDCAAVSALGLGSGKILHKVVVPRPLAHPGSRNGAIWPPPVSFWSTEREAWPRPRDGAHCEVAPRPCPTRC